MEMPFGQYEGTEIEDLPDGYLFWLETLDDLDGELTGEIQWAAAQRRAAKKRARETGPPGNIQRIETVYRGYRFRSRLEARWAVFLDAMGARWEYEKEGFRLSNQTCYLPDFWLPDLHCWLENKGQPPTGEELERCRLLRDATGSAVVLFEGLPEEGLYNGTLFCHDVGDSSAGSSEWEASLAASDEGELRLWVETHKDLFADPMFQIPIRLDDVCHGGGWIARAVRRARAARFEFGEDGLPATLPKDFDDWDL